MKRSTIFWVVGLMSVALLGLIGFQWYWIDSVIRANEERFKRDVVEALHNVSDKLERQEALYALNRTWFYNQPMMQASPSAMQPNPLRLRQIDPQNPSTLVLKDTLRSDEMGFNIIFDFQATTIDGRMEVVAESQLHGVQTTSDEGSSEFELLQQQMQKASNKS